MLIHFIFELSAYAIGIFLRWKVFSPHIEILKDNNLRYIYNIVALLGALAGAFLLGSLNTYFSLTSENSFIIGKSILGAIIGATIVIEIFKKIMKIQGSTGVYFVPSLVMGIAIGRIGCFMSGLDDYTYGIKTNFFLAYDFGDGVLRHPVQLYESFVMFLFFFYVVYVYFNHKNYFEKNIFYQFILLYATQRFIWEFLKPYEKVFWEFNLFQLFCLGLIFYAIYHLRRSS
jgi:prolipoprotein diacylglyceryltransferase